MCAQGFNCEELLYYDYGSLDEETEQRLKCRRVDLDELVRSVKLLLVKSTSCPQDFWGQTSPAAVCMYTGLAWTHDRLLAPRSREQHSVVMVV
jgi:hypothetical protein